MHIISIHSHESREGMGGLMAVHFFACIFFMQLIQHQLKSQMALNWFPILYPQHMHISLGLQFPLGWRQRLIRIIPKGCSIFDFSRAGGNQWLIKFLNKQLLQKISVPLPARILAQFNASLTSTIHKLSSYLYTFFKNLTFDTSFSSEFTKLTFHRWVWILYFMAAYNANTGIKDWSQNTLVWPGKFFPVMFFLGGLQKLTFLNLNGNQLHTLPSEINRYNNIILYLTIICRRRSDYCWIILEMKLRGLFNSNHWAWGE